MESKSRRSSPRWNLVNKGQVWVMNIKPPRSFWHNLQVSKVISKGGQLWVTKIKSNFNRLCPTRAIISLIMSQPSWKNHPFSCSPWRSIPGSPGATQLVFELQNLYSITTTPAKKKTYHINNKANSWHLIQCLSMPVSFILRVSVFMSQWFVWSRFLSAAKALYKESRTRQRPVMI